jgi:hypothetical protein
VASRLTLSPSSRAIASKTTNEAAGAEARPMGGVKLLRSTIPQISKTAWDYGSDHEIRLKRTTRVVSGVDHDGPMPP